MFLVRFRLCQFPMPRTHLAGSRFGVGSNCAQMVFSPEEDEWTGSCTGEVSASISGSSQGVQHGLLEEVISNTRARVTKLEASMAAVWESNATFSAPQEAFKKAQEQAQVRVVEDRIPSTKVFHRSCEEAGQFVRRRSRPRAGGPFEGTDETSVRRARVDRGRHEWRHSSRRPWDENGGAASPARMSILPTRRPSCGLESKSCNARTTICDPSCTEDPICRRTTAPTVQEFLEFHCRSGAHESFAFGLHGEWDGGPLMKRRSFRVVSEEGDIDQG